MYGADPTNPTPAPLDMPSGYTISLYLTGIDSSSGGRVFFGFAAVADGEPSIIAIRGTDNLCEWLTDLDVTPISFPPYGNNDAYVATGFYEFLENMEWAMPPSSDDDAASAGGKGGTLDTMPRVGGDQTDLVVVGHSLGGAVATLFVAHVQQMSFSDNLTLVTAASPAVGDAAFAQSFNSANSSLSWRYINDLDMVANAFDLIYTQVGTEVSQWSADIYPTPGCEHALTTYQYLFGPSDASCTGDCCIIDDAVQARVAKVAEQRRSQATRRRGAA